MFEVNGIIEDAHMGVEVGLIPLSNERHKAPLLFARTTLEPPVAPERASFPPLIAQ
jgi:hypothetical protein